MASQGQAWQKDAADQNFDYMFKLLIIGNSSVGKTSFLFRYADDSFTSAFVSTVGIDFKVKTVFRQDKRVKLQIWVRVTYSTHPCYLSYWKQVLYICTYVHDCIGHCWAGEIPYDHDSLLPGRYGFHPHV